MTARGMRMRNRCVLLLVGLALGLGWAGVVRAQAPPPGVKAGVVTTLQGEATVARPILPQPVALRFKEDVFVRDLVSTGPASIVRLLLGGRVVVTVRELSSLAVTEEPGKATIDMKGGRLAVGVAKDLLRPGESVEVRTPNAIAAIRGSALVSEVVEVGGQPQTSFTALEATVPITVASVANPQATVPLGANQAVSISGTGAAAVMSPVRAITPAEARTAAQTAEAPKFKDHTEGVPAAAIQRIGAASCRRRRCWRARWCLGLPTPCRLPSSRPPRACRRPTSASTSSRPRKCRRCWRRSSRPSRPREPPVEPPVAPPAGPPVEPPAGPPVEPPVAPPVNPTATPVLTLTGPVALGVNDFVFPTSDSRQGTAPYVVISDAQVTSVQQPVRALGGIAVNLAGPLLSSVRSDIRTGDPASNVFGLVFVADGAQLFSASPDPLLRFDTTTVDSAGPLVVARRSPSMAAPTAILLVGPLLEATNSTFDTTSLGFDAVFGTTGTRPCCSGFSFSQGAQVFSSSALPFIALHNSRFNAGPDAQTGGNFFFVGDTFTGAPASELVAPAFVGLSGPLLSASGSVLSALSNLVLVSNGVLTSSSPDYLISLTESSVRTGDHVFNAITAGTGDPSSAGTGAIVSLAGGLLSATSTTIQSDGNLVRIGDGALVFSSTPNPLVTFSGGSFVGAPVGSVQGGSLLRMFSQAGRDGSFLFLSGPYLSAANAEFNVQDHVGFNIADGSVILSTTTAPFASFTGGSIASPASNFIAVHSRSSFTTPGQPTTTGNGEPSAVELAGGLLDVRGTRITSAGLRPGFSFMFMGDSSTVVSVGSAPLLSFDAATLDLNGPVLSLRRSNSSAEPTTLALAGPLFAASQGTRVDTTTAGVGTGACCAGFFMAQGSLLTGAGTEALIQLSNSTFAAGDPVRSGANFFSLNDSGAAAGEANQLVEPAHLSLAGPLVSASDSSISTLFHLLSVARSDVVGTTPDALIQLSGATLTIGGQNPFTPETAPSGRLVNVASGATGGASANDAFLGVAGPLLSATASTLTLATDAVGVFNGATLTSTTAAPLLQLNSTTLNAGAPSRFGAILNIGGTGGPSGAQFSTVTLSGAVLSATDSSVTASAGLLNISPGGQLTVVGGTAPLFSLTGGNYDFRNDGNFTAMRLGGRSAAATGTETVNGVTPHAGDGSAAAVPRPAVPDVRHLRLGATALQHGFRAV